ncbi:MAG: membrane integrity-associated transporter subunit PqiC [Phycisphaerae bacterium]|nr:membrane integrity-associated transporter subunit PqiC [Phycisphaerae bacterium]
MDRQQQFVLDAPRPAGPPKYTPAKGVLKVRRFAAASQYDTYEMVYRRSDLVYDSDFYNRFFASPTSLVAEKVRQWLSDSGVFAHVLDPFSGADFAYILEGNVLALYGDYRQKGRPQAVMAIQFTLIDEHRRRDSVLFQKDYHAVAPMEKEAASQLVLGFNACLADILLQLESDLAGIVTDGQ